MGQSQAEWRHLPFETPTLVSINPSVRRTTFERQYLYLDAAVTSYVRAMTVFYIR